MPNIAPKAPGLINRQLTKAERSTVDRAYFTFRLPPPLRYYTATLHRVSVDGASSWWTEINGERVRIPDDVPIYGSSSAALSAFLRAFYPNGEESA